MTSGQGKIWYDGTFVDWQDATCHVMCHVIHYGSSVFEGIRCYEVGGGPAVFRLSDHMRRLYDSAKIYRMAIPYTQDEFEAAVLEAVPEYEEIYTKLAEIYNSRDRIPTPAMRGAWIYNFWQDAEHVRGIWRRTFLSEFVTGDPAWETVIDLDALAEQMAASYRTADHWFDDSQTTSLLRVGAA